jgi:hypothetical protein
VPRVAINGCSVDRYASLEADLQLIVPVCQPRSFECSLGKGHKMTTLAMNDGKEGPHFKMIRSITGFSCRRAANLVHVQLCEALR